MLLTGFAIRREVSEGRLVFDPPVADGQIGASSVDLRLGNAFVTFDAEVALQRKTTGRDNPFDVARYDFQELLRNYGEETQLADDEEMPLPPWKFMLGWTKEYIKLPNTLAARVEGKSKAARLGLMVHITAPTVHVGWEGNLQLEFINLGPAPLMLRPGMEICQLMLEQVIEPAAYEGQFQRQRRSPL